MAEESNDTQSKINAEDRDIASRPENRTGHDRDKWNQGSSSMPGGENQAQGIFAHEGEGVTGEALGGGPLGTGNTGAELPGGAQSEFARTSGGQTAEQNAGSVGTIGGSRSDTELVRDSNEDESGAE